MVQPWPLASARASARSVSSSTRSVSPASQRASARATAAGRSRSSSFTRTAMSRASSSAGHGSRVAAPGVHDADHDERAEAAVRQRAGPRAREVRGGERAASAQRPWSSAMRGRPAARYVPRRAGRGRRRTARLPRDPRSPCRTRGCRARSPRGCSRRPPAWASCPCSSAWSAPQQLVTALRELEDISAVPTLRSAPTITSVVADPLRHAIAFSPHSRVPEVEVHQVSRCARVVGLRERTARRQRFEDLDRAGAGSHTRTPSPWYHASRESQLYASPSRRRSPVATWISSASVTASTASSIRPLRKHSCARRSSSAARRVSGSPPRAAGPRRSARLPRGARRGSPRDRRPARSTRGRPRRRRPPRRDARAARARRGRRARPAPPGAARRAGRAGARPRSWRERSRAGTRPCRRSARSMPEARQASSSGRSSAVICSSSQISARGRATATASSRRRAGG